MKPTKVKAAIALALVSTAVVVWSDTGLVEAIGSVALVGSGVLASIKTKAKDLI